MKFGLDIYREGDSIKVYDSRCPHQVTNIPHLALEGTRLTCPKHKWAFDVSTGECVEIGSSPLNEFDHKIEDNRLLIQRDHVIREMLGKLGATVREVTEPFTPEGGAYGHGRTHGHSH